MGADENNALATLIDRIAIEDLIYRYSDAVTRADWDQCEATFAPDALWESPGLGLRFETAREFLDVLVQTTSSELLIQAPHAPVIRVLEPTSAQATTTIREFVRTVGVADTSVGEAGSEQNFEQWGIYFDEIAKQGGDWKFTRRLFVPMYIGPGAVTGQVMTPRSDLLRPGS
jgi:SnoaL-like domain